MHDLKPLLVAEMSEDNLRSRLETMALENSLINNKKELAEFFEQDPERVADMLKEIARKQRNPDIADLLGKLCGRSPKFRGEAAAWLDANLTGAYRLLGKAGFTKGLVSISLADARQYLMTLSPGPARDFAGQITIQAYAKTDPQEACHLFWEEYDSLSQTSTNAVSACMFTIIRKVSETLSSADLENLLMKQDFQKLALLDSSNSVALIDQKHPELAIEWALSVQDPRKRADAMERLACNRVSAGDEEALANLVERSSGELSLDDVLQNFIDRKFSDGQVNPVEIDQLPASGNDSILFALTVKHIGPEGTVAWVGTMPPGLRRSSAIKGLANQLREFSAADTRKFVSDIRDNDLRYEVTQELDKNPN
jgi:hypothetical protein